MPDRADHLRRIAALEPVGQHQHQRAAGIAGEARHCEEGGQRIADPRAAVPVGDEVRRDGKRLFAILQPQRTGQPRQPRAEREHLDAGCCVDQRMGKAQMRVGARLH